MHKKEALKPGQTTQCRQDDFYWRGGDPLTEQEYLLEEYSKARQEYKNETEQLEKLKEEHRACTLILEEKQGYTDALAGFLDGRPEENRIQQKGKKKLQKLERIINSRSDELSLLQMEQNPAFAGSLQSELAYLLIEVKRNGKRVSNFEGSRARAVRHLSVINLSKAYMDIRVNENQLDYLKLKNKKLKGMVETLNAHMCTMHMELIDRNQTKMRKAMTEQLDAKMQINRLKMKEEFYAKKHEMFLMHLIGYVEEMNERMRELGMPEEEQVNVDELKEQIFGKLQKQMEEETERKITAKRERKEMKAMRKEEIEKQLEIEESNKKKFDILKKKQDFHALKDQAEEAKAKSVLERQRILDYLEKERNRSKHANQTTNKELTPIILRPQPKSTLAPIIKTEKKGTKLGNEEAMIPIHKKPIPKNVVSFEAKTREKSPRKQKTTAPIDNTRPPSRLGKREKLSPFRSEQDIFQTQQDSFQTDLDTTQTQQDKLQTHLDIYKADEARNTEQQETTIEIKDNDENAFSLHGLLDKTLGGTKSNLTTDNNSNAIVFLKDAEEDSDVSNAKESNQDNNISGINIKYDQPDEDSFDSDDSEELKTDKVRSSISSTKSGTQDNSAFEDVKNKEPKDDFGNSFEKSDMNDETKNYDLNDSFEKASMKDENKSDGFDDSFDKEDMENETKNDDSNDSFEKASMKEENKSDDFDDSFDSQQTKQQSSREEFDNTKTDDSFEKTNMKNENKSDDFDDSFDSQQTKHQNSKEEFERTKTNESDDFESDF